MLLTQMWTSVSSSRSLGTDGRSSANELSITFSLSRLSAAESSSAGSVTGAAPRARSASITVAMWPTHFSMNRDHNARRSVLVRAESAASETARCEPNVSTKTLMPMRHSAFRSAGGLATMFSSAESASTSTRSNKVSMTASLDGK